MHQQSKRTQYGECGAADQIKIENTLSIEGGTQRKLLTEPGLVPILNTYRSAFGSSDVGEFAPELSNIFSNKSPEWGKIAGDKAGRAGKLYTREPLRRKDYEGYKGMNGYSVKYAWACW